MKYYKHTETGEVYAYETAAERQEWGAPELVEMSAEEVEAHLNPRPTTEQLASQARAERDSLLAKALECIDRYEKQVKTPNITPDDSEETYIDLLVHVQALRDVPQQADFPENIDWPESPV